MRGCVFLMFTEDHNPPHFHVFYGEHRARIAIADGNLIGGSLPAPMRRLASRWAQARRAELEAAWARAIQLEPPGKIAPLD